MRGQIFLISLVLVLINVSTYAASQEKETENSRQTESSAPSAFMIENIDIVLGEFSGEGVLSSSDTYTGSSFQKKCDFRINFDLNKKFVDYWHGEFCGETTPFTFRLLKEGKDLFLVDAFDRRKGISGYVEGQKYKVSFQWARYKDFHWSTDYASENCQNHIENIKLTTTLHYEFDLSQEGQIRYKSHWKEEYLPQYQIEACWQAGEASQFIHTRKKTYSGTLFRKQSP